MTEKLKPCQFCNETPVFMDMPDFDDVVLTIACNFCGIESCETINFDLNEIEKSYENYKNNKSKLINKWNTRI